MALIALCHLSRQVAARSAGRRAPSGRKESPARRQAPAIERAPANRTTGMNRLRRRRRRRRRPDRQQAAARAPSADRGRSRESARLHRSLAAAQPPANRPTTRQSRERCTRLQAGAASMDRAHRRTGARSAILGSMPPAGGRGPQQLPRNGRGSRRVARPGTRRDHRAPVRCLWTPLTWRFGPPAIAGHPGRKGASTVPRSLEKYPGSVRPLTSNAQIRADRPEVQRRKRSVSCEFGTVLSDREGWRQKTPDR
jgi:hypothetical protein